MRELLHPCPRGQRANSFVATPRVVNVDRATAKLDSKRLDAGTTWAVDSKAVRGLVDSS